MFKVFLRLAESFYNLMTSSVKVTSSLGVIIPLLCTWTISYTALASATKTSSLDPATFSLNAEESTTLFPGQSAIFLCAGEYKPDTAVQWLKDDISIVQPVSTSNKSQKRRKRRSRWRRSHHRDKRSLLGGGSGTRTNLSNTYSDTSRIFSTNISTSVYDFTVLHNGSLLIDKVKRSHAGVYKCFIQKSNTRLLRRKFSLTISTNLPQCTIHPSTNSAHQFGAARFFCSINITGIDVIYSWSKDGRFLPKNKKFIQLANGALQIFGLQPEDAGNYRCHIKVAHIEAASQFAHLEVLPQKSATPEANGFQVLAEPQNVTVYPPYTNGAILECLVEEPYVTYGWTRAKEDNGNRKDICPDPLCPLVTRFGVNNLILGNTIGVRGDYYSGEYICTVRHQNNTISIKRKARLNVNVPAAALHLDPKESELRLAAVVRMTCTITGHHQPNIYWLKNGVALHGEEESGRVTIGRSMTGSDGESYSFLMIKAVETDDSGIYQCVAESDVGQTSAWTNLDIPIRVLVPSPQNVVATTLGEKEILVTWDEPDNDRIVAYTVIYEADYGRGGDVPVSVRTNRTVLTELHPFTVYRIKVKAHTRQDTSEPSKIATTRTNEGVPCPRVEGDFMTLTAVNSTTVLVSWKSPPIAGRCGIITEYEVNCNDFRKVIVQTRKKTDDFKSVNEYAVISGLEPGEEYPISITPISKVGKGYEWRFSDLQLPQAELQGCTKTGESVFDYVSGSFDDNNENLYVSWSLTPEFRHKAVAVKITPSEEGLSKTIFITKPETNTTFKSLDPGQAYFITLSIDDNDGVECEKKKIVVLSHVGSKNQRDLPSDIKAEALVKGCIELNWLYNGTDELYVVRYSFSDVTAHRNQYKYQKSNVTSATVCGLKPYSNYNFAVASTVDENAPYENLTFAEMEKYVRTLEEAPGLPADLYCVSRGKGRANCGWRSPRNSNGDIISYTLQYRKHDDRTWESVTSNVTDTPLLNNVDVDCLKPETRYYFRVYATNKAGSGNPSINAQMHMENYDASLVDCPTEPPVVPVSNPLYMYIAIAIGSFVFLVAMVVLLICLLCKKKTHTTHQNGSAKNGSIPNGSANHVKRNGYYLRNEQLTDREVIDEQNTNLLPNGGDHGVYCNGFDSVHKNGHVKYNIVKKNGFHKDLPENGRLNGGLSPKHNGIKNSREKNGTKNSFGFDTLLRLKSEKAHTMAVPESNEDMLSRHRLVLSIPIPKHSSMMSDSASAGSRDQHCSTSFDSRSEGF